MTAFCKVVLLIAGLESCVQSAISNWRPQRYTVPQPLIQALRPEGLKVSIPHTEGIQLFAFHGNINKPLDPSEKGLLHGDVLHRDGDQWVYTNSTVKLEVGDQIHYRLFVLKDKFGYRLQDQVYEITNEPVIASTTAAPEPTSAPDHNRTICVKMVLNLTQSLFDLQQEIDSLREMNVVLKDLVGKHPDTSKTLALDGVKVKDDELVAIVQAIIEDKLHLPFKVANVRRIQSGLVKFEVASVEEKLEVVKAAKRKLKYSRFRIGY